MKARIPSTQAYCTITKAKHLVTAGCYLKVVAVFVCRAEIEEERQLTGVLTPDIFLTYMSDTPPVMCK